MSNADEPAYPELRESVDKEAPYRGHVFKSDGGLTKRELFAAMAMCGKLGDSSESGEYEDYAVTAVGMADALLAELERTGK